MWHTCQLIMIVSLDIINNNQIRCHSLGFCNVTGTFIYFKPIKLAIATTLVVNVRVLFNFTTWNKVVYTSGYVITYIIKTTEPNHLILILNLANKSYFIIKVNFCHLLAWFKNYNPLKVGVNSFWDTLYVYTLKVFGPLWPTRKINWEPYLYWWLISCANILDTILLTPLRGKTSNWCKNWWLICP